ncbi:MAG: Flp pilus assembly protein CpaB [Acidobacteriia bacterium]|nr:Flp pilus assembly protein CpaB [Terriglobia bacterium]
MNKRFLGVLVFATVVAAVGGLLTYRFLISRQQSAKAAPTVRIALAARDLQVGSVLKEEDIQLADWSGAVPVGATNRAVELKGRGVMTAMYAKEPIIESRLAPPGAGGGLAMMIPNGMRAMALQVNDVVGVAGFVVPGMHVDVLISGSGPTGNAGLGTLTKTLLQNIEILSAGQDFRKDAEGKPIPVAVVNVLVTPAQAEILSLASSSTSIRLVLRNPLDKEESKPPGTALAYLFAGGAKRLPEASAERPPARPRTAPAAPRPLAQELPPARKETPFVMEIISGVSKSETKFDNKGEGK